MPAVQPIPLRADVNAVHRAAMQSLTRACLGIGLKTLSRSNWPAVETMLKGDRDADLLVKAATSPATLANNPVLAHIVPAFVSALVPVSASAALINRSPQLSFDGAAQVSLPGLTMPHAAFVGEGQAIPVTQGDSTVTAVLDPYKLAVLVSLTGEMMRNTNAEALVRAALLSNVGPSLDAAMFSNAAGVPGVSPPGILNGVTGLTGTAGGGVAAASEDVAALADALAPVAGNGQIVLIAAIKQSVALAMLLPNGPPFPTFASSPLPAGTVIAVATQALATIVGAPQIEASGDVTVQDQTTPTGDLMTGSPVRNVFQSDSVSLRFKLPCSWALRGPGVAFVEGTSW